MARRSRRSVLRALGGTGLGIGLAGCLGPERATEAAANVFVSSGALTVEPGGTRLTGQLRADGVAASGLESDDRVDPDTGVFSLGGEPGDTDRITFADGSLRALALKIESGEGFDLIGRGRILAENRTSFSARFTPTPTATPTPTPAPTSTPTPTETPAPPAGRSLVDGFEDGDTAVGARNWSGWRPHDPDEGRVSVTRNALRGSFSGRYENFAGDGSKLVATRDRPSRITAVGALYKPVEIGDAGQSGGFSIWNGTDIMAGVSFKGDNTILSYTDEEKLPVVGSYTLGTRYRIELLNVNYDTKQYDVTVTRDADGTVVVQRTGVAFQNGRTAADRVVINSDYDRSTVIQVFDGVTVVEE